MKDQLNNLTFLFPVMIYYAFEALLVGVFISIIWKFILTNTFGNIGYFQIVAIYWIFKMLYFNVFNLISRLGFNSEMQENNNDSMDYNETISE